MVIIGAFVFGGTILINTAINAIKNLIPSQPPQEASITSSPTVLQGVHQLGQLTTTSFQLAKVDLSVNTRNGIANICSITAHHASQGTIEAGIDLTQITENHIQFDAEKNEYVFTLPPPSLTNCILDPITTNQYHVSGTSVFCNANRDELRRIASYQALVEFRDEAVESGILDRAQQTTEILLTSFLTGISNGANIKLVFDETITASYPNSCLPTPPENWVFDEDINRWKKD